MNIADIPFVITHYAKLTDRRAYLDAAFAKFGVTPHWITDGDAQTMTVDQINKFYQYEPAGRSRTWQEGVKPRLSEAAISCGIKHVLAHQLIAREGWPMAVVLEDDVRFCTDFETRFPKFVSSLPADWDCALFGSATTALRNCTGSMGTG